jgi:hypothetical protein
MVLGWRNAVAVTTEEEEEEEKEDCYVSGIIVKVTT